MESSFNHERRSWLKPRFICRLGEVSVDLLRSEVTFSCSMLDSVDLDYRDSPFIFIIKNGGLQPYS